LEKGTLLSLHVSQSILQSTLLSAVLLQDIHVGARVGWSLKLSPNENSCYCTSMLATITSIIVP